jgi:hypothetical protein
MTVAFEGGEQLGHFAFRQVLTHSVRFVRLSTLRGDWSHFARFYHP